MSYQQDTIDWQAIRFIDEWLDEMVSADYHNQPLAQDWARVAKVSEECGEAIQALIGYTGQNPRKGKSGSQGDLLNELADIVMTGILALQHFTKDTGLTKAVIRAKLRAIEERVPMANR
jgi:hypothetical protein